MVEYGDKVTHIKDDSLNGVVIDVDDNLIDVTTCLVVWGVETLEEALKLKDDADIQWTNKLMTID